jgi:hypothetical protein
LDLGEARAEVARLLPAGVELHLRGASLRLAGWAPVPLPELVVRFRPPAAAAWGERPERGDAQELGTDARQRPLDEVLHRV